jgi:hypothetical protein
MGSRVEVNMPGLSDHGRVGTVVALTPTVARVRFGDGSERLIPRSKLRKRL